MGITPLQVQYSRSALLSGMDYALKLVLAPYGKSHRDLAPDDKFVFYHGKLLPLRLIADELAVQGDTSMDISELAYSLEGDGFRILSVEKVEAILGGRWRGTSADSRKEKREHFLAVLTAYGGRCAISRCDVIEALDVVPISRRRNAPRLELQNSILLRSDLSRAFRNDLILICPDTRTVGVRVWACASVPYWNEVANIPNSVMRGPFLRENFEDSRGRARRRR